MLVVDAAQGVQAQTVSNYLLCLESGLEVITALNKCDLPFADPDGVAKQVLDSPFREIRGILLKMGECEFTCIKIEFNISMQYALESANSHRALANCKYGFKNRWKAY